MNNPFNTAIIFIRIFGCIFIFSGLIAIAFVPIYLFLYFIPMPDWLLQNISSFAVECMVTFPIWIIAGCGLIIYSRPLAKFIINACESNGTPS